MTPTSSKPNQFGSPQPEKLTGQGAGGYHCSQCEAMLTDVLDGTLDETEQDAFDLHLVGCPSCSQMLAEARRGHAWLELLRDPRPEPSAALLERILLQTSGTQVSSQPSGSTSVGTLAPLDGPPGSPFLVPGIGIPVRGTLLPFRTRAANAFRHTVLQPRLAMTAAMAFFSVALTLNLTGVHLSELRASDLRPSTLRRDFYEANARAVRTFDNLKVVYELESRVRDLQRASDSDASAPTPAGSNSDSDRPANQPQPDAQPGQKQKPRPKSGAGSSRQIPPGGNRWFVGTAHRQHETDNPVVLAASSPRRKSKSQGGLA